MPGEASLARTGGGGVFGVALLATPVPGTVAGAELALAWPCHRESRALLAKERGDARLVKHRLCAVRGAISQAHESTHSVVLSVEEPLLRRVLLCRLLRVYTGRVRHWHAFSKFSVVVHFPIQIHYTDDF